MHNQKEQQHLKTNNIISKFAVIVLSIVLLTGLALVPALQIGVNGQVQQQQQPSQQKQVGISQVIKQIAEQVANANPGTNVTQVQQILVQLAKQTAQTASQEQAIQEIQQISSQITKFPYGTVSQSLAHFAGQLVSASTSGRADTGTTNNVIQIAQQIAQEKASSGGGNVSQSVVNKAIQTATGANSNNINQHIRQTAQLISKQTGVPVEKVEAIIIQMALQIAQAQGKDVTGQSIFQIANQIAKNPNGIFTQLILQLVKQDTDDGGKNGHTVKIIKTVVRDGGSDSNSGGGNGNNNGKDGTKQPSSKPSMPELKPKQVPWDTPEPPSGKIIKISVIAWKDSTGQIIYKVRPNVEGDKATVNKELSTAVQELQQQPKQTTTSTPTPGAATPTTPGAATPTTPGAATPTTPGAATPTTPGAATPTTPGLLEVGNTRVSTGDNRFSLNLCFICASGNDIDIQRATKLAMQTAELTGASVESAELTVSDTYLRTANKAGPAQASQTLASFEADATANPNSLNKIGDLAKLYDSGNDVAANQASDSIADKLSTGANPATALAGTPISEPVSLAAAGGTAATGEGGTATATPPGPGQAAVDTPGTAATAAGGTTTGGEGAAAGGTTTGGEGAAAGGTGEFSDDDTGDEDTGDEDEDDTGDDDTSVAEFSEGGDDETSDGSTDGDGEDGDGDGDGGDGDGDGGDGDGDGGDGDGDGGDGDGDGGDGDGDGGDGGGGEEE